MNMKHPLTGYIRLIRQLDRSCFSLVYELTRYHDMLMTRRERYIHE